MHYFRRSLPAMALVGLLFVAGCDLFGREDDENGTDPDDVLVPLEVGNTWTYQLGGPGGVTRQVSIDRAVTQNGVTYYLAGQGLLDALRNGDNGTYTAEYDSTAEGITVENEFLFFRYPADDGATYSFRGREITVERETVNVPAGTFENAYTYSYGEESGGSLRVSFAPGVGFVLIESEGGPIELISYDVD